MADATLLDVIERMKAEGQLTRNNGSNSIKSVKELISQMKARDEESAKDASERNQQLAEIKQALIDGDEEQVEVITKSEDNLTTGDDVELLREEVKREMEVIELLREIRDNTAGMGQPQRREEDDGDSGNSIASIGAAAAAVGAALGAGAGIILGQLKAIAATFETFFPRTTEAIRRQMRLLRVFFKRTLPRQITAVVDGIVDVFRNFRTNISARFIRFADAVGDIFRPAGNILKSFGAAFARIGALFAPITKLFTGAGETLKSLSQFKMPKLDFPGGKAFTDALETVGKFIRQVGSVFARVATVIGRLFAPLAIVLAVFDSVTGAIDGFTKDQGGIISKIFAGLEGGISGLVVGLIGMPLDLLKSGLAWIAGKLGFENAQATLNSFSFSDFIRELINIPFNLVRKTIDGIKNLFTKEDGSFGLPSLSEYIGTVLAAPFELFRFVLSKIAALFGFDAAAEKLDSIPLKERFIEVIQTAIDSIMNFFTSMVDKIKAFGANLAEGASNAFNAATLLLKNVLRSILPVPQPDGNWYDPANLASKAIPRAVYEFAGIDKDTGEMIELPEPEITISDPTPIKTEIDKEQLQEEVDRNIPNVQFETEQPVSVDGTQTEIDKPVVSNREAQQLQLERENRQREERAAANSGGAPIVIGGSSANITNNSSSSNTTVGLTGTSGDPNDRYWGG